MKKVWFCLIIIFFFSACMDDADKEYEDISSVVVEGWIEDGGFPVVILTRPMPISSVYRRMDKLSDYIVQWAKVTVSCGKDSVVLTGKYDPHYYPPFVYTTGRMRGEAGKQYSLTVDYRDIHATAMTTIPASPPYCSFFIEPYKGTYGRYQIKASFRDDSSKRNYYQFLICEGPESSHYHLSYLGSISNEIISGKVEVPVYREPQLLQGRYQPYFTADDVFSIKFAKVDETSFKIWESLTKNLILSSNMFFSTSSDVLTNISGGYGYWCGYNAQVHHVVIRDSLFSNDLD